MRLPIKIIDTYPHTANHYSNNPQLDKICKLYEGISKSYQPKEVISAIKKIEPECQIMAYPIDSYGHPSRSITLFFEITPELNIDRVLQIITTCGWFVSESTVECKDYTTEKYLDIHLLMKDIPSLVDPVNLIIKIESRYGYAIDDIIKKKFKQVYHLTPTKYVAKILQIGLTPKSQAKINAHPERIYFALTLQAIEELLPRFVQITLEKEWTILTIDSVAFTGHPGHHVYTDPEFEGLGAFTLANIPPSNITVYRSFTTE